MLLKVDEQIPAPMGFGQSNADRRSSNALAIAGSVAPSALTKVKTAAESVDAVLLTSSDKGQ